MTDDVLRVGPVAARPGEKAFGFAEITAGGQALRLPVFVINGAAPGPTLVATAGVHAAEYASIAAALEVAQKLQPAELRGRVIIAPVINAPGYPGRAIYVCPLDGKNPNRFFPGDPAGSASEQLAGWVFENIIRQADYYVDLHGGDLIEALTPFTLFYRSGNAAVDDKSLEMARVFGIRYIVRSETPGSTYSAASRAGIPAILAEAGGQGIWTAEDVACHRAGLERLLRHLGLLPGPQPAAAACTVLDQFLWVRSEHAGCWYPACAVGDSVAAGQELGRVQDFEGRVLQTATAPAGGAVLFLVTSLAINAGDPLLAVGA